MKALILIDLINDLLIKRGYLEKLDKDFFENLSKTIKNAKNKGLLIIHVKLGFLDNYENQPKSSPLFGKAHEFGLFKIGSEGTEFYNKNDILTSDIIITKSRVNPFYNTDLDKILKQNNISEIFVGGIATDLAVSSFAREAHDRDYKVNILSDLCGSLNYEDHENELKILAKIANIKASDEIN
ncbi:MAG: cysteine hydrolase [Candidatus Gracilibacteria bacterium]|nr:cysteine hydrolase [Candidatus Gracilibacteria bacterium]